jgi:hypothetical protein
MANTFVKIASVTVGSGGAANIEFTSIPGTYTDLKLVYCTRTNRSVFVEAIYLEFNGSGGTAYSDRLLFGTGAAALSNSSSSQANINNVGITAGNTATANTFGNGEIYIPNYTGSQNKSTSADATGENNATDSYMYFNSGLWANSAAITQIKLVPVNGNNFLQYSTATLYGIKSS